MAEDEKQSETPEQGGGMFKKVLFGGAALLLVAIGIVAGSMLMGNDEPDPAEAEESAEAQASGPPIYQSLHPPLVVNFQSESGESHFMQITMEVMSRDQGAINAVREHTPVIRNGLILLYGNAIYESVTTREGKEQMLAEGLADIRRIRNEQGSDGDAVEAVYFTSLVIQ